LAEPRSASISSQSVSKGKDQRRNGSSSTPLAQGNQNDTRALIDFFTIFALQYFRTFRNYTSSCASSADGCPADLTCNTAPAIECDSGLLLRPDDVSASELDGFICSLRQHAFVVPGTRLPYESIRRADTSNSYSNNHGFGAPHRNVGFRPARSVRLLMESRPCQISSSSSIPQKPKRRR
jgi:hypothetical protein